MTLQSFSQVSSDMFRLGEMLTSERLLQVLTALSNTEIVLSKIKSNLIDVSCEFFLINCARIFVVFF